MEESIIKNLTSKDNSYAYALTEKIVSESNDSDIWYDFFDDFATMLDSKKSLERNRAIAILAANVQWDDSKRFDLIFPSFLIHITDEKPITARQCIKALAVIGQAKPEYTPVILKSLHEADLSKYNDSMRLLIEKDIEETEKKLISIK